MILLSLIQNIALLVTLAAMHQVIAARLNRGRVIPQVLTGLLFGGVGLVGMMTPLQFMPGVIFDGRSIILSVAGLFGGPIVAVIAAAMCAAYRLWLGGAGVWVGVGVIIEASALGVIFHYLRRRADQPMSPLWLWCFGLLVHAGMMPLMLALPGGAGRGVIRDIGLPVLLLYPLATMLICLLLQDYEKQRSDRDALSASRAQLSESNQLMRAVLDHTRMLEVYLDERFNFIWVNRAYAEACRHEPAFFPGKNHFELYPNAENREIFQRVVDTGEPFSVAAKPFVFPDQPERGVTYWDWSLIPIKAAAGKVTGLVFSLMEVTDRIQAQQTLRINEERHRAFVNASVDMAFMKDEAFRYVMVNEANREFFGKAESEIIGKTDFELMPEEMARNCRRTDEQALREGRVVVSTEAVEKRVYETRKFPVSLGGVAGVGGFIRDITEQTRASERVKQQLDELRRWQSVTVGREERIAELKREVNGLAERLGEKPRYEG